MEGYVPTDNLQFAVSKMVNQQPFFDFRPCRELLLAAFASGIALTDLTGFFSMPMFEPTMPKSMVVEDFTQTFTHVAHVRI